MRRHKIERCTKELLEQGFCIVPGAIASRTVAALSRDLAPVFEATPQSVGPFYGSGTRRFGSLLKRSEHAAAFVQNELILGVVEAALGPWCDRFQLNLTQAIEIAPGAGIQPPHRDQDMWGGPKGEMEYLVNVMWPYTEYTVQNGATRLWRGSHKQQEHFFLPEEEAIFAEMEPGSALLFLGSTLHGGSPNVSRAARRGMIVSYCLGWLKPYENQWLAYPPDVARHFPPELAALVGYFQHRPNLGNYEGRCPSILLRDEVPEHPGAQDELRPDQEELIAAWLAGEFQLERAA
jgi:ectoine hydroxylase-related dioxygenase (phytanoyl-CoA dioxygenase family)